MNPSQHKYVLLLLFINWGRMKIAKPGSSGTACVCWPGHFLCQKKNRFFLQKSRHIITESYNGLLYNKSTTCPLLVVKLLASRERIDGRLIRKDSDSLFKMHHHRVRVCLEKKLDSYYPYLLLGVCGIFFGTFGRFLLN